MSGTDLVYETVQGRNGLENLASTYWYSDGLMHEPTVAYQNMLSGGLTNALTRLEGYQPPAGYDPLQRGYQPFPDSSFLKRPELVLPRKKHWEVVFPNGSAIPFGDSGRGFRGVFVGRHSGGGDGDGPDAGVDGAGDGGVFRGLPRRGRGEQPRAVGGVPGLPVHAGGGAVGAGSAGVVGGVVVAALNLYV